MQKSSKNSNPADRGSFRRRRQEGNRTDLAGCVSACLRRAVHPNRQARRRLERDKAQAFMDPVSMVQRRFAAGRKRYRYSLRSSQRRKENLREAGAYAARERLQGAAEPPADTMETIPIIVRRSSTVVDAPSSRELLRQRTLSSRAAQSLVTLGFDMWQAVASTIAAYIGWKPRVAPYVGYGTTRYVRLICRTVLGMRRLAPAGTVSLGIRNMLMIPAPHTQVRMTIDGVPVHTAQVGNSEAFEPIGGTEELKGDSIYSDSKGYLDLLARRRLKTGEHQASYKVRGRQAVEAPVYIFPVTTRVGIISDVDDTILVSQVTSIFKAVYNFLLRSPNERASVPGMAVLYARIRDMFPDAPFFYLSTSPWNVETTIRSFIERYGFPKGPMLLRDLDPRPKTFIPSGVQHKLEFVEQLMSDFPRMKFILFGDDGQRDPTTYARLTHMYPGRIIAIGIRQLSRGETTLQQKLNLGTPEAPAPDVPVFYGPTGASLMRSMIPYLQEAVKPAKKAPKGRSRNRSRDRGNGQEERKQD